MTTTATPEPRWYPDIALTPAAAEAGHPGLHRATAAAWQHVTTEHITAHRHLHVPAPGRAPELVSFFLTTRSPYWNAWESTTGTGPVWNGPVVYAPSLYSGHGGAGLGSPQTAALTIANGIEQARRWGACALVMPHLTAAHTAIARQAAEPDADLFANLGYTAAVRPRGLEEHLAALPNRKAARGFARAHRRATEAGLRLRVLRGDDLAGALPAFTALARDVDAKHSAAKVGADTIAATAAAPGSLLLAAEHDGTLVGGFLSVEYGGCLYLSTAGIDYTRLRQLHTYEWLMGTAIQYAADRQLHTIDAGRSNHLVKVRWGFAAHELRTLVYLTAADPGLAGALRRLGDGLRAHARDSGAPL